MEDSKIIELYFKRDEQAVAETDAKYGRLCRSISLNILGSCDDAEECVNDTYIGAWNAIPPARPNNFMAFICKITRNLSIKRLEFLTREKRSPNLLLSLDELADLLPDEHIAPDASDEDIGKLIANFLRSQNEDVRTVFIRRYFFFDSVEDIAKRCSFTVSKVKNMLFRTRNKLKDYLIREGVEL